VLESCKRIPAGQGLGVIYREAVVFSARVLGTFGVEMELHATRIGPMRGIRGSIQRLRGRRAGRGDGLVNNGGLYSG
jgi:hypothetical protein